MRLIFPLFTLLLLSYTAQAQKLTGIWRGYFSSSSGLSKEGSREEMYKYEIQIDQQTNNSVLGITYSYKSTVFYGKAELTGIFTATSKSLILKETKMLELKAAEGEACLMTCYLDYSKIGKMEVLEGNFFSTNSKTKSDCGSGKVYLERVATSDFKKEDFLTRKKTEDTAKTKVKTPVTNSATTTNPVSSVPNTTQNKKDNLVTKAAPLKPNTQPSQKQPVTSGTIKKTTPPPVKNDAAKNKPVSKENAPAVTAKPAERIQEESVTTKKEDQSTITQPEKGQKIPIPKVLVERENNLIKTITTSDENIRVDLYDNGIIDNDTISVYHNNQLVVSNGRLSISPITVKIKCSKTDNRHEFVIVAENLGEYPPNTATMVITTGNPRERYEVQLSSNEQRNAKVVINYVPKE
jgi:hypothetical protein